MLMGYSDNEDMISFDGVKYFVRKPVKEMFSDIAAFDRPGCGMYQDPFYRGLLSKLREDDFHSPKTCSIGTPLTLPSR